MNQLKLFESPKFGQVRTIEEDGKILFVANDAAKALGYANPSKATNDHCKNAVMRWGNDSLGRQQEFKFIPEGDLYRLITNSKIPSAEEFESWVFDEVLPSIRKTGSYEIPKSATELFKLALGSIEETNAKIEAVKDDLQEFKMDMPILGIECDRITAAVKKKGVECLGGKKSNAYHDKSLRSKVYTDIYSQLKREFDITTYKAIKRSQSDFAVKIVDEYRIPFVLNEEIEEANRQVCI